MAIDLRGRTAIVTGAGQGLGRTHALMLASRGARVMVNDFGGARDGTGGAEGPAAAVAREIRERGGEALWDASSVTDIEGVAGMVERARREWGSVDILVANAGVLRDKTFAKMTLEDFRFVLDVHLMGSVICAKAVWDLMREQAWGRIVFTTSSSGLYGNFGQSNYGAAKMGLVGLMQTLALEGSKHNVRVNCLAPTAATRMTEDLMPPEVLAELKPERVSDGLLALVGDDAPTRMILCAGAGGFEAAHVTLTQGVHVAEGPDAPDEVVRRLDEIRGRAGEMVPDSGQVQGAHELSKAAQSGRG
ncbi:SDR family NAD(P)-dependent oxidoreductase [Brevundimonas sp. 2R-24]|uniref:SDR family NAD(P)-dependent oxidoreductase n=1 Tax=Peiella sedimenti TaxID=3061083 RepID=A0ABT8SLM2_9CAUL|nr:SDR family NAD(P)-dependent oxidoreductase [Caulobacteraceae bacterium XZ-24]